MPTRSAWHRRWFTLAGAAMLLLGQAAPLHLLPDDPTDLDKSWLRRSDRAGAVIHEYRLVA